MSADLDDAPSLEHDDAVGKASRPQTVGNEDRRPPPGHLAELAVDLRLRLWVERSRRFVQDDDGGLAD